MQWLGHVLRMGNDKELRKEIDFRVVWTWKRAVTDDKNKAGKKEVKKDSSRKDVINRAKTQNAV